MVPGELLVDSLRIAARRIRRQRWLRDGAWGAAFLLAIVACAAVVGRVATDAAVVVALRALLMVGGALVAIGLAIRLRFQPSLESVASRVDAAAGLHEELASAYWFATRGDATPFVGQHVQRAAAVAHGLDWPRLLPFSVPPRAVLAAAAAILALGLAWWLPPGAPPVAGSSEGVVAVGRAVSGLESEGAAPRLSDDPDDPAPDATTQREATTLWKQVQALAAGFGRSPEGRTLAEAIAARDARAAVEALRAARSEASAPVSGGGAADGPGEQMTDALAQGILERLASLLKSETSTPAARSPGTDDAERPTARLDRELRADQDDAQPGVKREQTAGEDALNTSLRALSRSGTAGRDAVHGEADTTEGAGRANVGGGAMGRRVGVSTGGAGDGDQPVGNLAAPEQGDQVLGRRTERLAVQLKAVKVPESAAGDADNTATGTEESFYAATRAQVARVGFGASGGASQSDAEGTASAPAAPVEYRAAVKRYTLTRHRRDADARAAESAR